MSLPQSVVVMVHNKRTEGPNELSQLLQTVGRVTPERARQVTGAVPTRGCRRGDRVARACWSCFRVPLLCLILRVFYLLETGSSKCRDGSTICVDELAAHGWVSGQR